MKTSQYLLFLSMDKEPFNSRNREISFLDAVCNKTTFNYVRFSLFVVLLMLLGSFSWANESVVVSSEEIGWRKSDGNLIYFRNSEELFSGTVQVLRPDGSIQKKYRVLNGLRDGAWVEWWENGQKLVEANWKEGKKFGSTTWWYDTGRKWKEIHFDENGKYLASEFYDNGPKLKDTPWKDGKMHGKGRTYYENAKVLREVTYIDGKKDGPVIWWHENGMKWKEYTYAKGRMNGLYVLWRENGQKWKEYGVLNDKMEGRHTTWQSNGNKLKEVFYENGNLNGSLTTWWINGLIQETGAFKDNQRDGLFTGFHENGRKAYEARFNNGLLISQHKWMPTGEKTLIKDDSNQLIEVIEKE